MADILLLLKFIILLNENHFQQIQVVIKLLFSYLVLSRKGDTQGRGRDTEIIRKTERTSGRQKKKQAVFGVKLLLCIYYVPGSIFGATLRDPAAHTFLRGKPILQGRHHEHQHHLQQHTGPRALMEVGQPKKNLKSLLHIRDAQDQAECKHLLFPGASCRVHTIPTSPPQGRGQPLAWAASPAASPAQR